MKTTSGWLLALAACFAMASLCRGSADQLIEQLDAPEFASRQEASRKLTEGGKDVFPDVEKAAEAGSREVASRAIEILRSHFQGGDEGTREAARAALERLASGSNASAAQRARDILNPPPEPQIGNLGGINPAMLQLMQQQAMQQALQRQQMQLQIRGRMAPGAPGGFVRRTSVRTINGQREIEVQDGGKITKVRDVPGGGIEGQVTETVNGKETTRKVEAKDLQDLKQKDAELAKVYEQFQPPPAAPRNPARVPNPFE